MPLNAASSSGECRTKSTPALTAIAAALSCENIFEMASIVIESVKMRPLNFSSLRSSPVRIGRLSVAGMPGVGSRAGSTMCDDMTASTPAAMAALNGTSST